MATALVVGTVATGVMGARGQKKAGKEAKKLAGQNAANERAETAESARRLGEQQKRATDMTIGTQGSSGIKMGSGSTGSYLDEMQKAFSDDLDWLKKSGESRAKSIEQGGVVAEKQATASAWGTVSSSMSSMISFWA